MNDQCDSFRHRSFRSNAVFAFLVLALCIGQSSCEQKPTPNASPPYEPPTHNADGYVIQPKPSYLVGGQDRLFIQFEVNGNDSKPFILYIENGEAIKPHDHWPPAPDVQKDNTPKSGGSLGLASLLSTIEDPPQPLNWVSLDSAEGELLANATKKYFVWADTAAKENLHVAEKQMLTLTNQGFFKVTFHRPNESSNALMNLYVANQNTPEKFNPTSRITLDKMGVQRLELVVSDLLGRREKFIAFRDEQEKIVKQRQADQQREKARADELLR